MSRREARKHAFIAVYQIPFHNPADSDALNEIFSLYMDGLTDEDGLNDLSDGDKIFTERAAKGVFEKLAELDAVIARLLKGWQLERVNRIDLALLRLCLYEMHYEEDIPQRVSINEAVELAKQYGADESSAFVNGLLGEAAKGNFHE